MNLWIRSQDRTTLIRSYEIYVSEQCNHYLIRAKRTSHILGSYKNFERALKVLDEIQEHIIHQGEKYIDFEHGGYMYSNVYQMPEE